MKEKLLLLLIILCLGFILAGCDLFNDDEPIDEGMTGDIGHLQLRGYGQIPKVNDIAISPDDKYIYVAYEGGPMTSIHPNGTDGSRGRSVIPTGAGILMLRRDKVTGWLLGGDPSSDDYAYVEQPTSVIVSPDGKYVYASDWMGNKIIRFKRDYGTGRLSDPVSKSTPGIEKIYMPKDGAHMYYVNAGEVHWLTRDGNDGKLSGDVSNDYIFVSTIYDLAFSPLGEHAYAGAWERVHWFERDFNTGKLRADITSDHYYSTSSDFTNLVVSNDGKRVFVSDGGMSEFISLERKSSDGSLGNYQMIFDNFGGGNFIPQKILLSKDGINIYLYNSFDWNIRQFMFESGESIKEIGYVTNEYSVLSSVNSMIITNDGKHVYTGSWSGGPSGNGVVGFLTRQTDYKK